MPRPIHYILKNKTPIAVDSTLQWAEWFGTSDRIVKQTTVGETEVSTIFLGIDHQHFNGPPLLFETMVFGGKFDQDMDRCSTWEQAKEQHRDMVYKVTVFET